MKILSILEMRQLNKQILVDEEGNPILDKDGNVQYYTPKRLPLIPFDDNDWDETDYENWLVNDKNGGNLLLTYTRHNQARSLTLEGYAKGDGVLFDAQWGQYSYEEIIEMEQEGVVIPQDVINWAHSMANSDPSAFLTESEPDNEGVSDATDPEIKEDSYLSFKNGANAAIKECEEKSDESRKSLEDLSRLQAELEEIQEEAQDKQIDSLEEMKKVSKEWENLQKKVKNGEQLSESEQSRLEELQGIFENADSDYEAQMKKDIQTMEDISISLYNKNILSKDVEIAGDKAVEIAEGFKDFNLKDKSVQTGFSKAFGVAGFLGMLKAISMAKNLAQETMTAGNDAQSFSAQTQLDLNAVASIMDLQIETGDIKDSEQEIISAGKVGVKNNLAKTSETSGEQPVDDADNNTEDANPAQDVPTDGTTEPTGEEPAETDVNGTENADETEGNEEEQNAEEETPEGNLQNSLSKANAQRALNIAVEAQGADSQNEGEKALAEVNKTNKENKETENEESENNEIITSALAKIAELSNRNAKVSGENSQIIDENPTDETVTTEIEDNNSTIEENETSMNNLNGDTAAAILSIQETSKEVENKNLTAEERFNKALEKNKRYDATLPDSKERTTSTTKNGVLCTVVGTYHTVLGTTQIVNGTALLSNPFTMGLGAALIALGTTNFEIGTNFLDTGLTLTELGFAGFDKIGTTDDQIGESDKNLKSAIETVSQKAKDAAAKQEDSETTDDTTSEDGSDATLTVSSNKLVKLNEDENPVGDGTTPDNEDPADNTTDTTDTTDNTDTTNQTEGSKDKKESKQLTTDDAGNQVSGITSSAKDDNKETLEVKKDTEKTEKELEKEAKKLQQIMKKDQKDIIRMTKQSNVAARKQAEAVAEFETLVNENEILIQEDSQKMNAPQNPAPAAQNNMAVNQSNAVTAGQPTDNNQAQIDANDERLNEISVDFNQNGKIIDRNSVKIQRLQKLTKTRSKRFDKVVKVKEKKANDEAKAEEAKQKRLQKQLGAVGIANNLFSITMSTGSIMMLIPWTAAAGKILFDIGLYGTIACGVAKATINIANGNLTAGLISLGQTIITAASSMVGAGSAANGVMTAVSSGLSVVSNTAELVNNVRAVQGKEASGLFSAISTIAGVGSSLTNSANSLGNMGGASTLGKLGTIASAAGSVMSGIGQITTLIDEDSEFGKMMNNIGTAVGSIGAVATLANSAKAKSDSKNEDNQKQAEENKTKADNTDKKVDETKTNETKTTETKNEQDKPTNDQKSEVDKTKKEVEQKTSDKDNKNKTDKTNEKENNKSKDKVAKAKAKEDKKAEKAAQKKRENNIKNEGASEKYADMDNDELFKELSQAMRNNDDSRAVELSHEKTRRVTFKANADLENSQKSTMDKVLDYAQLGGNILNAAGGFLASNDDGKVEDEKHIKKFFNMSDYAKEIARKRKMRVASIDAMYRAR